MRAILIQGDSVRMTWGIEEPATRKPLRRDPAPSAAPPEPCADPLSIRIGEELDYVRRTLGAVREELAADPILLRRHKVALRSLETVAEILGHIGDVVRSGDRRLAVEAIGMGDLKARLTRRSSP